MSRLCEGRVAIVTGAGRGIGREHALLLAKHGARVVVNDIGTSGDGVGSDETPAQEVVRAIKEMGGDAVVNTDNVADFLGAKRMVDQALIAARQALSWIASRRALPSAGNGTPRLLA